ncbi:MAG: hypothetical protein JWM95_295 [Gemmatimonadetes bacterium]|nr:hypothetical protein [Gemmatimonadota bacterium]
MAYVATREHHDLVWSHVLVDDGVRESMQECTADLSIVGQRCVHQRMQSEKLDGCFELGNEGTPETPHLGVIPDASLTNFGPGLGPKRNAWHT